MKKPIYIYIFGLMILFSISCSSETEQSIELIDSKVEIISDKERLGSYGFNEEGIELIPTSLYYEFSLKNDGKVKIGELINDPLKIEIEPNDTLINASNEVIGFNVFNPFYYNNTGLGYGGSSTPVLKPGEEGQFILTFDLGVSHENNHIKVMVPPVERLKILEDNALDATLIISTNVGEIARFDLHK